MKNNFCRFILVVLIISSLINSGCSVIGYRMGAKFDNSRADYKIVDPEDYETIKNSQEITVYLNDNSVMKGNFDGVTDQHLVLIKPSLDDLDIRYIKLDEINSIEIKTTGQTEARWFGLGIGLALDFVAAYALFWAYIISAGGIGT